MTTKSCLYILQVETGFIKRQLELAYESFARFRKFYERLDYEKSTDNDKSNSLQSEIC